MCRPLTLAEYSDFENGREPEWGGFSNPFRHLINGPSPLAFRIPRVKREPSFAEIGLVLSVEKASSEIIGSAGFHDFPDAAGMIEIGFGIVPEKQNQGFGLELLHGMWNMIAKYPEVKILRYTVSPENIPSMHIIEKLGFQRIGQQVDEDDGLELIYEESVNEYLAKR
jgi:RimJ/RimL family protein N-acetyltransferase